MKRPTSADQISKWHEGYAWLAGGTWLFSEPQPSTDTLIDLEELRWSALRASAAGLRPDGAHPRRAEIGAIVLVALYAFMVLAFWLLF